MPFWTCRSASMALRLMSSEISLLLNAFFARRSIARHVCELCSINFGARQVLRLEMGNRSESLFLADAIPDRLVSG